MAIRNFFFELRRRRVGRVAIAYAIAGWVLVQVADTIFPRLLLPDWTITVLLVLVLAGFPLAVTLAWFFDVVPEAKAATPAGRARRWIAGAAVLGVLVFVVGLSYHFLPHLLRIDAAPRAIVVLPFENLSGDPAEEYFVAGMHDALISELGKIAALRVISRTSAMRYRGSDKSLPEIARELAVDMAVEGSVHRSGDDVQIRVNLIQAVPEERRLWGQEYRRRLHEVLAMNGDMARAIAQSIQVELTPDQAARLAAASPVDPATYEAYLRGMYHLNRLTPGDLRTGIRYFRDAVERNPADPLAYAGLATAYITIGHSPAPTPEARHMVRASAERAIRLDPDLAEAHSALATSKLYYEYDWEGALAHFQRAHELNPNLPMNHYHYAWYLALFDRMDEAIEAHKRAQALDPFQPLHTAWLGGLYYMAGRYEEAVAEALKSLEINPDYTQGWFVLGDTYALMGRFEEAIEAHEYLATIGPNLRFPLGVTCAKAGREDCARRIAAELEAGRINSMTALGLAAIYAQLGDHDRAFQWLNYEPAHAWLPWVRRVDAFAPLWNDERLMEILDRLRLPPPPGHQTRASPRTVLREHEPAPQSAALEAESG